MAHSIPRRTVLAALAGALPLAGLPALASTWPQRPVRLMVGAPPGGPSDFLARLYADAVGTQLGGGFVVDNKPGASGTLAADAAAKAVADGHTLLVTGPASITSAPYLFKVNYDPTADFVPVSMLGAGAFAMVAHPSVPARNVAELIALAKAKPGGLAYGSGGSGASGHLCTESFCQATGTRMVHVPYKGDSPAMNDLLAGQTQLMFTAPNVAMPHVKSGKLRLLGVTTRERVASLPDVPAVAETVKDFEYLGWIIVFAPAATPRAVTDQLIAAWGKSRGLPNVRGRLEDLAMVAPERLVSGEPLAQFVKSEAVRLARLIKDANIKVD